MNIESLKNRDDEFIPPRFETDPSKRELNSWRTAIINGTYGRDAVDPQIVKTLHRQQIERAVLNEPTNEAGSQASS